MPARLSKSLGAVLFVTLLAMSLAAPALAAPQRIDDRALQLSKGKKGWTKVSSRKAYKRTLSRTRKANATAATKVAASNGGSVTFQTGPGRGKFVLTVGKAKKTVKTSSKKVKLKTVAFRGAGKVKLKVTKPGSGVYLDAVTLTRPLPLDNDIAPPPGCPAGVSDAGTMTSALGTALRVCQLPGRVSSNLVLQKIAQVVYSLAGPVEVGSDVGGDGTQAGGNPVTLTIAPGVVVIADGPTDALFVNRGSRLSATGTAAQPIVFTSRSNLLGVANEGSTGLWGGITLLGRAPISDCDIAVAGGAVNCQRALPSFTLKYGSNLPNDSSGSLSFVQIRFAGAPPGPGLEGVGLRAAAVGSLTTLDHIQVTNSGGDGLSVLGGRVNFTNLALVGAGDDGLDTDIGYRGTVQYLVGSQAGSGIGDALIEADSNGNEDALPRQYTRVSNATLIGRSTVPGSNVVLLRGGTDFGLLNAVVTGPVNCLDIDETAGTTTRAADGSLQDLGAPIFRSVGLACPTAFANDGNVSTVTVSEKFGSGTNNNNSAFAQTLSGLINGPNETAIPSTDPSAFNADVYAGAGQPNTAAPNRMSATTYAGAIQNASDSRFRGWTCDTSFASFGSGANCVTSPL